MDILTFLKDWMEGIAVITALGLFWWTLRRENKKYKEDADAEHRAIREEAAGWRATTEKRVEILEKRLDGHETKCDSRTQSIHQKIDGMGRDINKRLDRLLEGMK